MLIVQDRIEACRVGTSHKVFSLMNKAGFRTLVHGGENLIRAWLLGVLQVKAANGAQSTSYQYVRPGDSMGWQSTHGRRKRSGADLEEG